MSDLKEVLVPDIGDFKNVEVIEVLVRPGDAIEKEQSLITLESDKATMDIPSPHSGKVKKVNLSAGDKVSQDTLILTMEISTTAKDKSEKAKPEEPALYQAASSLTSTGADIHAEVVVLGAGPGGYTAAFRSADLGKKTVLVERYPTLGGVCLNVGCIPSKALLHIARVITEVEELKELGIDLGNSNADKKPVHAWTEGVVAKLTNGLKQMAKQRKIEVIQGTGRFTSTHTIAVENGKNTTTISFDHAIIAAGSQAAIIPGLPEDPRIMDSTSALLLETLPKRMLVIGGGIIGLEIATVYDALGSKITVVKSHQETL
ncbi:MAG: dihydrolipoamide dehydrogenase [Gammaproteobacteria bacterium]|nr:dihydrolipoamide dehydrogenase [Gammaproteobacteria bacterium]